MNLCCQIFIHFTIKILYYFTQGKHKVSAHDILEVILEIESSNTRSTLTKNNELGRPDIKSTKENVKQTTTFTGTLK